MHIVMCVVFIVILNEVGVKAAPYLKDNSIIYSTSSDVEILDTSVYQLPCKLQKLQQIYIQGTFTDAKNKMTVNLVKAHKETRSPDFDNVACQVRLDFGNGSTTINRKVEGEFRRKDEGLHPADWFSDIDFNVLFTIQSHKKSIGLELQNSSTQHDCELEHNLEDIEYLTVGGDLKQVNSLHFVIGS